MSETSAPERETGQQVLYRQRDFPVFQNRMYATAADALACPRGDIELVEDELTGLVHNAAFDPALMVYDRDYQNEQGVSPAFRDHLHAVAELVEARLGKAGLIEIGCGKGFFLDMLAARGSEISGFDPSYEGDNPLIHRRYFSAGENIRAGGLIMRHVLEHVRDPYAFLQTIQQSNGGGGLLYIEVPCFDWILDQRAWFDVFYEHVNYFRLPNLLGMFGTVLHAERLFGGQYLGVVVELASLRPPRKTVGKPLVLPADFGRISLRRKPQGAVTAIWGGASKGVIFSLLCQRAGHSVEVVIDINPAKQGRYLPGTGLRVQSPAEALPALPDGSVVYVMNPMYLSEIREMAGPRLRCVGLRNE